MQIIFDTLLEKEFEQIYHKLKKIEHETSTEYKKDLELIIQKMVCFDELPTKLERENFNVAAIDGSGAESILTLNDISIHLLCASFAADQTVFQLGTTKELHLTPTICSNPEGLIRLSLLKETDEQDVWNDFAEFIHKNYGEKLEIVISNVLESIVRYHYSYLSSNKPLPRLMTQQDIRMKAAEIGLRFDPQSRPFQDYKNWLVSAKQGNLQKNWFEQFRETLEYSIANALLKTDTTFKYLFIDGSLNMLLGPKQDQPRLASNYLLRNVCDEAFQKGTCVIAVSKTTTIPYIYRFAKDIQQLFHEEKKWFFRIPIPQDTNTIFHDKELLKLQQDKPHIPPRYAVTYLYHFSNEVPVLRLDLDFRWWKENIYSSDEEKQKENELILFQEIDWLARDARYYGYFFDLAFAHNSTLVSFPERDLITNQLIDYFAEQGEDAQMFVSPRKRLGLM